MTVRFRQDNTEGYSDADLAALNVAFQEIMNANPDLWANDTSPGRDLAFRSWQDNVGRGAPDQVRPRPARRRAANDPIIRCMTNLELKDVQAEALIRELHEIIRNVRDRISH